MVELAAFERSPQRTAEVRRVPTNRPSVCNSDGFAFVERCWQTEVTHNIGLQRTKPFSGDRPYFDAALG